MKKDNLRIEEVYKENLNRYDLKFIYKEKLQLLFILPTEEKEYKESLKTDKAIKKILKLFYIYYKIFGKSTTEYFAREKGVDFLLEEKDKTHEGNVYLEIIEEEGN